MTLVTLAIRPQFWYIIRHNDKRKKSALLIPTILFKIIYKKAAHFYNQLYIIVSPDILY